MLRLLVPLGALVTVAAFAPGWVLAQSTDQINAVTQLHLMSPGARGLAMGGASLAVTEEGTAAQINPAALVRRPGFELFLEARASDFSDEFIDSGTVSLSGDGQLALQNAAINETNDSVLGASFASFFFGSSSSRWALGAFRHEPLRRETEVRSGGATLPEGLLNPITGTYEIRVESYGIAGALTVFRSLDGKSGFSVGTTVSWSRLDLESRVERLDNLRGVEDPSNPASLDAPNGAIAEVDAECCAYENRGDVRHFETQSGQDESMAYNLGLLWQAPAYSIGAAARRAPDFQVLANSYDRVFDGQTSERAFLSQGPWYGSLEVPDSWGIGGSLHPSDRWIVSLEWDRVEYAELVGQMLDVTGKERDLSGTGCAPGTAFTCQGLTGEGRDFTVKNADEVRLGAEFSVPGLSESRLLLRCGVWLDPDHELRYRGSLTDQAAMFLPGTDRWHGTAGIGYGGPKFQVDLGLDVAHSVTTASLTGSFRFGKN